MSTRRIKTAIREMEARGVRFTEEERQSMLAMTDEHIDQVTELANIAARLSHATTCRMLARLMLACFTFADAKEDLYRALNLSDQLEGGQT